MSSPVNTFTFASDYQFVASDVNCDFNQILDYFKCLIEATVYKGILPGFIKLKFYCFRMTSKCLLNISSKFKEFSEILHLSDLRTCITLNLFIVLKLKEVYICKEQNFLF